MLSRVSRASAPISCRFSTKLLSAWLTVVITVERLLAVALPLKVGRLSTPFRMRCVVAVLSVVCVVLGLFPLWTLNVEYIDKDKQACLYRLEREDEYKAWLMAVRRVGTLALPTTLLIICSSLIIYLVARARHARPQVNALLSQGHRSKVKIKVLPGTASLVSLFITVRAVATD